jgi:hypothetical protein
VKVVKKAEVDSSPKVKVNVRGAWLLLSCSIYTSQHLQIAVSLPFFNSTYEPIHSLSKHFNINMAQATKYETIMIEDSLRKSIIGTFD